MQAGKEHASRHQAALPLPHKTVRQLHGPPGREARPVRAVCAASLHTRPCCLQLQGRTRQMEQVQSLSSSLPMDGALWRELGWTDSAWR